MGFADGKVGYAQVKPFTVHGSAMPISHEFNIESG
jgi:hypothetical protein